MAQVLKIYLRKSFEFSERENFSGILLSEKISGYCYPKSSEGDKSPKTFQTVILNFWFPPPQLRDSISHNLKLIGENLRR